MQAISSSTGGLRHTVRVGEHEFTVDEPLSEGGTDAGPSPLELLAASLASCTAITMQLYGKRKGWNMDGVEVACEFNPAERGCATRFELIMRLPDHLDDDQVEKLQVIGAKCPIHRALDGEAMFVERVERTHVAS